MVALLAGPSFIVRGLGWRMNARNDPQFACIAMCAGVVAVVSICGCAATDRVHAAAHQIGREPTVERIDTEGVYRVRWAEAGKKGHNLPGTDRYLIVGEMVGFETASDGHVYAYAAGRRTDLTEVLPPQVDEVRWYYAQKHLTPIGSAVADTIDQMGPAVMEAAADAAVKGAFKAMGGNAFDDDCDQDGKKKAKRQ
jgi:hypothetical protein